jgi:hypothetical protein
MVAKIIGLRPNLSPHVLSRKTIFDLVFPNSTRDWLASEINKQIGINKVQESAGGGPLTGDDITLTVATLLLAIVDPSATFDQFVKNTQ